jgi:hypothetical protein
MAYTTEVLWVNRQTEPEPEPSRNLDIVIKRKNRGSVYEEEFEEGGSTANIPEEAKRQVWLEHQDW